MFGLNYFFTLKIVSVYNILQPKNAFICTLSSKLGLVNREVHFIKIKTYQSTFKCYCLGLITNIISMKKKEIDLLFN